MYHYIVKEGRAQAPTFIVLHGTGGNEEDLIPVAQRIEPDAQIIGVRGDVNEAGALRFFKRVEEGKYDWEDLADRGERLDTFIRSLAETLDFSLDETYLLGFSNGANIAYHLLVERRFPAKGAFLFAPMYPKDMKGEELDLGNKPVFLSMGQADPIVPMAESERILQQLEAAHADVELFWVNRHEITTESLQAAQAFYEKTK